MLIDSPEVPMIYFFPAYHKRPPFLKFLGNPRLSDIANFVQKNADIKFEMSMNLA